ncbi:hypothetical protein, partial [Pseudomonas savastanoi]|uniref:hypothetical protein n=1 Tax=Pseudomonas savastanoi TaxID=29438 RepID=UPI000A9125E8
LEYSRADSLHDFVYTLLGPVRSEQEAGFCMALYISFSMLRTAKKNQKSTTQSEISTPQN